MVTLEHIEANQVAMRTVTGYEVRDEARKHVLRSNIRVNCS